ncbi:MAG: hypothetical protein ACI391_01440 [Muribaculaceae bacterium]
MKKVLLFAALSVAICENVFAYGGFIDQGPTTGWSECGTGVYTDGLVCSVVNDFGEFPSGQSWEVTFEENTENPGWYRFQPFAGEWPGVDIVGESIGYFTINATDPDNVFIIDSGKILRLPDRWLCVFAQRVPWNLYEETMYGTLKDGVITFPANSFYLYRLSPETSHDPTQQSVINTDASLKITLPSEASVCDLSADDSEQPVTYFTLQGVEVDEPGCGVFIVKVGNQVKKVIRR